jgi:hypothetical protein
MRDNFLKSGTFGDDGLQSTMRTDKGLPYPQ